MRRTILVLLLAGLTPTAQAAETKTAPAMSYQVPYRLTSTNHILVRVKINGKGPFHFILDTGAPALFVSTAVCRKLGVQPDAQGWGTFERFAIEGGVVLKNARGRIEDPFQLAGMNSLGLAGAELHGVIGYSLLARFRLEFDFNKDKLRWTPLNFEPPAPQGLDGQATSGMDVISGMMKMLGALLGKKPEPEIIPRGFLGMGLEERKNTLRIESVLAGSPAALAGLQAGDRIQRFQGKPVQSLAEFERLAMKLAPNEVIPLTITRGGQAQTLQIKVGKGL
jgi:membrane-associated protease RseP (regulator of RpoE activity)